MEVKKKDRGIFPMIPVEYVLIVRYMREDVARGRSDEEHANVLPMRLAMHESKLLKSVL